MGLLYRIADRLSQLHVRRPRVVVIIVFGREGVCMSERHPDKAETVVGLQQTLEGSMPASMRRR